MASINMSYNTPANITARRYRVRILKTLGFTIPQIAERLEVSLGTANKDSAWVTNNPLETMPAVEEIHAIEYDYIDQLQKGVATGDIGAGPARVVADMSMKKVDIAKSLHAIRQESGEAADIDQMEADSAPLDD